MMPREDWAAGEYTVVIHPAIEDLAGNTIHHLFEEEGRRARPTGLAHRLIEIPFNMSK